MAMNEKEKLITLLEYLNDKELSSLRKLVEVMTEKALERRETKGFLKISESAFADWDNEEDDVYNDL